MILPNVSNDRICGNGKVMSAKAITACVLPLNPQGGGLLKRRIDPALQFHYFLCRLFSRCRIKMKDIEPFLPLAHINLQLIVSCIGRK